MDQEKFLVLLKINGKKNQRKASWHRPAFPEPKKWRHDDTMFKNIPNYVMNLRPVT